MKKIIRSLLVLLFLVCVASNSKIHAKDLSLTISEVNYNTETAC